MAYVTNLDTATAGAPSPKAAAVSLASFTRPANATAYTAGDVISDSASVAAVLEFPGVGRSGKIMRALLGVEELDTINLELYLFDAEPTNFLDNAALALVSADMPKLMGVLDFSDGSKKTVAAAITYYIPDLDASMGQPTPYVSDSGSLYGLLVTRSAYTPVSAAKFHLRLQLEVD